MPEQLQKLYEMINPKLSTDMTIEEVHKAFNEVVQTEFHMEGLTLDGGSQEIAMLHICRTISLDTILVDFSKDGFIVEAKLYFGD